MSLLWKPTIVFWEASRHSIGQTPQCVQDLFQTHRPWPRKPNLMRSRFICFDVSESEPERCYFPERKPAYHITIIGIVIATLFTVGLRLSSDLKGLLKTPRWAVNSWKYQHVDVNTAYRPCTGSSPRVAWYRTSFEWPAGLFSRKCSQFGSIENF